MRHIAILFISSLLLGGCQTVGTETTLIDTVVTNPTDYTRVKERRKQARAQIGESTFKQLGFAADPAFGVTAGIPLKHDKKLYAALDQIRDDIIRHWPIEKPEMSFLVTDQQAFIAETSPAGNIHLSIGALNSFSSFDEAYFVIGHEMAHTLLDHSSDVIDKGKLTKKTSKLAQLVSTATEEVSNDGSSTASVSKRAYVASKSFNSVLDTVVGPSWERGHEREADMLALDFLYRTGKSFEGSKSALRFQVKADEAREAFLKEKCGDHSSAIGSRLLNIGKKFVGTETEAEEPQDPICQQYHDFLADLTATHPKASKRLSFLSKYQAQHYGERDIVPIQSLDAGEFIATVSPGGPLHRTQAAQKAVAFLQSGMVEEAREAIKTAFEQSSDAASDEDYEEVLAWPYYARYKLRLVDGRNKAALGDLQTAVDGGTASAIMYLDLLHEYEKREKWESAYWTLIDLEGRFGPRIDLIDKKLRLTDTVQGPVKAWAVLSDCRGLSNSHYVEKCDAYAEESDLATRYEKARKKDKSKEKLSGQPSGANKQGKAL